MAEREALAGLKVQPYRRASWQATLKVVACAQALGEQCEAEIGMPYETLHLALGRLAAAIEVGKCDGAFRREIEEELRKLWRGKGSRIAGGSFHCTFPHLGIRLFII